MSCLLKKIEVQISIQGDMKCRYFNTRIHVLFGSDEDVQHTLHTHIQ